MADWAKDVSSLASALTSTRLIKVVVGSERATYMVPDVSLKGASNYFTAALRSQDYMGANRCEKGVLRFPEDTKEAWELLLFWIINKRLPEHETCDREVSSSVKVLPLCQAWMTADKYLISDVQDLIMLDLINTFEVDCSVVHLDVVQSVFAGTSPDSALRKLIAEEMLYSLYHTDLIDEEDLLSLDGSVGVTQTMLYAGRSWEKHRSTPSTRLQRGTWKEYMAGEGPSKHWVFREDE